MKILTKEQLEKNKNIPLQEIKSDIKEHQNEIDDYNLQLNILKKKPTENRLDIYLLEGQILQREEFINMLEQIYRYNDNK